MVGVAGRWVMPGTISIASPVKRYEAGNTPATCRPNGPSTTPTIAFLAVTHAVVLVAALLFAWRLRQVAATAERRLRVQAWQLAQLGGDDAG